MVKKTLYLGLVCLGFFLVTAYTTRKPKILIIGDSISIGYTPFVKTYFADSAIISHNPGNGEHTGKGLLKIQEWLGEENWDIIQFNWGLWDLCYRHPDSKEYGNRDKTHGKPTYTIDEYASNLESIISVVRKKTNAKLIFVTTTYVPKNEPGRNESDVQKYNDVAKMIMMRHAVIVNDIYESSISIHNNLGEGSNNVHYKKEGYEKLGELIIKCLETEIKL
ncbi:MAG: lysophospholipase L1-like esterase [Mariniflexile sp.]|jgi:lysophospholipase L1-like esterase